MRTLSFWNGLKNDDRNASAAIGNFDGVHLGHQSVIDIARAKSLETDTPLGIVTFEPHPREYFAPKAPTFRLMNAETREHRFEKLGVDRLYQLPFDAVLAGLTAEEFAREVISDGLGLAHVVVGSDFQFGKDRGGAVEDLEKFGKSMGFGVTIAPLIKDGDTEISSTAIRNALSEGRPRDAAAMLGHWHRIDGEVYGGDQRGRELGYPTANMSVNRLHTPKFGIYAVKATVLTGPHAGEYNGASSVGVRPTFGENKPNLETFLFDFSGDLYGEHLSIAFVEYLRPELKFDSVDELVKQMDQDCTRARQILSAV
ncbi:MAG: bifunctional riboflavin kinase/FMN adenylyltransferase [Marinosulfonomonas sp.]|nr:MAG: bifunctional riboflavin kinase/FMN adenylyltransferase [Marinosulfonomonas sp.]